MSQEIIAPANVHPARGYSHAIKTGNTIYVAGQVGVGEDNHVVAGGFAAQAGQAMENLRRVLAAAGATLRDVVKLNVFVKTMDETAGYREARKTYFGDHFPATTIVQVVSLALPELLIEIEAIAVVG